MHKDNKVVYDFVAIHDMKKFKSGAIKIFLILVGQGNAFCSNSFLSFNTCNHWKTSENLSSGKIDQWKDIVGKQ